MIPNFPFLCTNDFAFKKTFHNKKVLKGLLAALLFISPDDIKDIQLYLNGNQKINIEMQVLTFSYWKERFLFYLSKMYVKGFEKGHLYDELEHFIHISILGFDLFENPPFFSVFELWDKKNEQLYSDKLSIRVLELTQIEHATEEEKQSDIYLWAKMISSDDWEVLRMLAENNEYIKVAALFEEDVSLIKKIMEELP